jgi:hypothetical protein
VERAKARAEIRDDGHCTLMEPPGPRHTPQGALKDKIDSRWSVLGLLELIIEALFSSHTVNTKNRKHIKVNRYLVNLKY